MKNRNILFTLLLSFILMLGCASDGENGKAYLSFDWDWYTDWYADDNSATPESFYSNTNYETPEGTYNFIYGCSDEFGNVWGFEGTYEIVVNAGESGSWFTDGADGEDNYFVFLINGSGPDFWLSKETTKVKSKTLSINTLDMTKYNKVLIGEMTTETYKSANGFMIVKKQMYKLILK
jgi:hypothetical protein